MSALHGLRLLLEIVNPLAKLLVRVALSRVKPRYVFVHRLQKAVHFGQQPERII